MNFLNRIKAGTVSAVNKAKDKLNDNKGVSELVIVIVIIIIALLIIAYIFFPGMREMVTGWMDKMKEVTEEMFSFFK